MFYVCGAVAQTQTKMKKFIAIFQSSSRLIIISLEAESEDDARGRLVNDSFDEPTNVYEIKDGLNVLLNMKLYQQNEPTYM
jgi:hypothetical protein